MSALRARVARLEHGELGSRVIVVIAPGGSDVHHLLAEAGVTANDKDLVVVIAKVDTEECRITVDGKAVSLPGHPTRS